MSFFCSKPIMTCHPLPSSKSKFFGLAGRAKSCQMCIQSLSFPQPWPPTCLQMGQDLLGGIWKCVRHFWLSQRLSWEVVVVYLMPYILNFVACRSPPLCLTQQRIIPPQMPGAFLLGDDAAYTDSVTHF